MDLVIRPERYADREVVHAINLAAFGGTSEADLVSALRKQAKPIISLVAEHRNEVLGHILFSPAWLSEYPETRIMGLAPMAVLPQYQKKGIGTALVRAGLEACRNLGMSAVIVLGHPHYYPRFGFEPSSHFNIQSEYEVPEDVFMAIELEPGALSAVSGLARYHETFQMLD